MHEKVGITRESLKVIILDLRIGPFYVKWYLRAPRLRRFARGLANTVPARKLLKPGSQFIGLLPTPER